MILQWVIVAICAVLWRLGGWKWKICRHLVPAVLGLYLALYLELWWMFLVVGALGQVVCIGYGTPSE